MLETMPISEKLKMLRNRRGLTLDELAEQTGLSRSALSNYETNESKEVSQFALVTLAKFYTLTWTTFANRPYQMIKRPLNFLAIDTTSSASAPSFNYFNRTLFTSRYVQTMMLTAALYWSRLALELTS